MPSSNLVGNIDWVKLLQLLNIQVPHTQLPCNVECPFNCNGSLLLIHDYNTQIVWMHCRTCNFAGDLVDFSSKMWNGLTYIQTLEKLYHLGFTINKAQLQSKPLTHYIRYNVELRERIHTFWEASKNYLWLDNTKELRDLQQKLHIYLPLDKERWQTGPGSLIGGGHKREIERVFGPTIADGLTAVLENAGNNRIFIGPKWTQILIIPMFDLPGKIKGFFFIGRKCRIPKDIASRFIIGTTYTYNPLTSDLSKTDTGLACYDSVYTDSDTLIVTTDPLFAVKMHMWHYQDNTHRLPLVSMFATERHRTSLRIWQTINKKLIFWGPPSPELFRHAYHTNSRICLTGFNEHGPDINCTKLPLTQWIPKIKKDAIPWDDALIKIINNVSLALAENIITGMEAPSNDLKKFLTYCSDEVKTSVSLYLNKPRKILLDGYFIREENGWYVDNSNKLISEAILRIDKFIKQKSQNTTWCVGRILFKKQEIPFAVKYKQLAKDTAKFIRNFLISKNVGYAIIHKSHEKELINIAIMFHTPLFIELDETYGWNEKTQTFNLPDCVIKQAHNVVFQSPIDDITVPKRRYNINKTDIRRLKEYSYINDFLLLISTTLIHIFAKEYSATLHKILIFHNAKNCNKFLQNLYFRELRLSNRMFIEQPIDIKSLINDNFDTIELSKDNKFKYSASLSKKFLISFVIEWVKNRNIIKNDSNFLQSMLSAVTAYYNKLINKNIKIPNNVIYANLTYRNQKLLSLLLDSICKCTTNFKSYEDSTGVYIKVPFKDLGINMTEEDISLITAIFIDNNVIKLQQNINTDYWLIDEIVIKRHKMITGIGKQQ